MPFEFFENKEGRTWLPESTKAWGGYRVYSSENNDTTYISLLTDVYLKHSGKFARVFVKRQMEAQVVFKHAGKYWFIASDCTGWDPNLARSAMSDSIWGPWTELGNPCRGQDAA